MTTLTDTKARADVAVQQAELARPSATSPVPQVHLSISPTAGVGPDDVTALAEALTA